MSGSAWPKSRKQMYQLSDEAVVAGWVENPYFQYFCGEEYFQHRLPVDE